MKCEALRTTIEFAGILLAILTSLFGFEGADMFPDLAKSVPPSITNANLFAFERTSNETERISAARRM